MKRLFLCICIFLSLVPVVLWGQNRAGLQSSKLETEVLYDIEGIAYKQVWRKDGEVVRCCYLTRSGQKVENATWCVDTQWVSTLADKVLDKIRFDYTNCKRTGNSPFIGCSQIEYSGVKADGRIAKRI